MNQKRKQGKTTLIILSLICIVLIGISIIGSSVTSPVTGFTGMIITPIQKGMNQLGAFLSGFSSNMTDAAQLREENTQLQNQVDTLKANNSDEMLAITARAFVALGFADSTKEEILVPMVLKDDVWYLR